MQSNQSAPLLEDILLALGDKVPTTVTADAVRLSPFSKLELTNVKLTPYGQETLLTGGRLRARYSLVAILKGRTEVREGILQRVKTVLGPGIERNAYLEVWRAANMEAPPAGSAPIHSGFGQPRATIRFMSTPTAPYP